MFTKANSDHNTSGQPQTLISIKGPFLVHTHNGQEKDRLRLIQWEKQSVTDKTQIKPSWQKLNCCSPCDIMILYMPHVWKIHYNIRQQRTHCWIDSPHMMDTHIQENWSKTGICYSMDFSHCRFYKLHLQPYRHSISGTTVRSLLAQKHQCGWV